MNWLEFGGIRGINDSYPRVKTGFYLLVFLLVALSEGGAATLYVSASGTNPVAPFSSWGTAATNIQDAVVAASAGDTVLVTNGLYASGLAQNQTARVAITNAVMLLSVNGPQVTTISGGGYTGVYVGSNAVLRGFSITNGYVGVGCEVGAMVSNCIIAFNSSHGVSGGTLRNCVILRNSADSNGGGAYQAALFDCTLSTNIAGYFGSGGAAWLCLLSNCIVQGNTSVGYSGDGGGTSECLNQHCTFVGNITGGGGGGTKKGTNYDCTFIRNRASGGGGAYQGNNYNCIFSQNISTNSGGAISGGAAYNCTLTNNVALNGQGGGASSAELHNCLVSSNRAAAGGGGIADGTAYTCILSNNLASSGWGGAAYSATVVGCLIVSNNVNGPGGGVGGGSVYNCTIVGNSATNQGGGVYASGTVWGSIVYYNSAPVRSNWDASGFPVSLSCCAVPGSGSTTFTNAPMFINLGAGNFRLQSNSPCINSGVNGYPAVTNDLDGNRRIVGGLIDVGAYEFQTPTSILPYFWLWEYGLTNDGTADFADADSDGINNWLEWRGATDPTNAASGFRILSISNSGTGLAVQWVNGSQRSCFLQRSMNVSAQPAFTGIVSNLSSFSSGTYTDVTATGSGPYFYRIGMQ